MATVLVIAGGKPPPSGHDPGTPFDIPKPTRKGRGGEELYREAHDYETHDMPVPYLGGQGETKYREEQRESTPEFESREAQRNLGMEMGHEMRQENPNEPREIKAPARKLNPKVKRIIEQRTSRGMSRGT
jgi:hypothetical protein